MFESGWVVWHLGTGFKQGFLRKQLPPVLTIIIPSKRNAFYTNSILELSCCKGATGCGDRMKGKGNTNWGLGAFCDKGTVWMTLAGDSACQRIPDEDMTWWHLPLVRSPVYMCIFWRGHKSKLSHTGWVDEIGACDRGAFPRRPWPSNNSHSSHSSAF